MTYLPYKTIKIFQSKEYALVITFFPAPLIEYAQ